MVGSPALGCTVLAGCHKRHACLLLWVAVQLCSKLAGTKPPPGIVAERHRRQEGAACRCTCMF